MIEPLEEFEDFRVYVMRHEDRKKWTGQIREGNKEARICQWAASMAMNEIDTEHVACSCCDTVFLRDDVPLAFIVQIPIIKDPEMISATAGAACAECSKEADRWLVDQAIHRKGLAPTGARRGDRIH
jgi:hypothetical protein